MGFERFDPAAFLARLRKNENTEVTPATVATAATGHDDTDQTVAGVAALGKSANQPVASVATVAGGALQNEKPGRIHPRLRRALVRELWPTEDTRSFELNISVRSITPVVDACPSGIEPKDWRAAIEAAGRAMDATARSCGAYPVDNPVLKFRRPPTPPALGPEGDDLDDFLPPGLRWVDG
jgi:hypothetical protein